MAEFKKDHIKSIKDIKSSYIIKEVFSFIDEKLMLNMIIYNKHLQNKFEVDIEDYKKISGKYKIGEKNGIGKEYKLNTNILIFEGKYENGKRNGEGKEFYENGELKFEGEYENGERNGEGKEFYKNGELKFEGEYLNGERNGEGKEFNENGELQFEGEYFNGKKPNDHFNDSIVEYDPMEMWFNYQALFEKTKSFILKKPCDIEIEHTIFQFDKVARDAFFGSDNYADLLQDLLNGNIAILRKLIDNLMYSYHHAFYCYKGIIYTNFLYLLGIGAALCDDSFIRYIYNEYADDEPEDLDFDLSKRCYYNIMMPLIRNKKYMFNL